MVDMSTDTELLAISHAGSEMIWWQRLFGYTQLRLDKPTLYCDNMQTLRVLKSAAARAKTALRHVDIHQCWIRQEYERGNLKCEWVETSKMPADGLTKILVTTHTGHDSLRPHGLGGPMRRTPADCAETVRRPHLVGTAM